MRQLFYSNMIFTIDLIVFSFEIFCSLLFFPARNEKTFLMTSISNFKIKTGCYFNLSILFF